MPRVIVTLIKRSATYHTRDLTNTPGQMGINATLMNSKLTSEERLSDSLPRPNK